MIVVAVIAMKKKKDSSIKPYSGYKPGYSSSGSSLYHTSSTTQMLKTDVHVDMADSQDDLLNYTSSASSFSFTPPTSPASLYTPPPTVTVNNSNYKPTPVRTAPQRPPARKAPLAPKVSASGFAPSAPVQNGTAATHNRPSPVIPLAKPAGAQKLPPLVPPSTNKAIPQLRPAPMAPPKKDTATPQLTPAPMAPPKAEKPFTPPQHNVPLKPTPASKPAPAPKPHTNDVASAPAPKPKPKPKPLVPAEKPAAKPDVVVPPKPALKPAGLDSGHNKPNPGKEKGKLCTLVPRYRNSFNVYRFRQ